MAKICTAIGWIVGLLAATWQTAIVAILLAIGTGLGSYLGTYLGKLAINRLRKKNKSLPEP